MGYFNCFFAVFFAWEARQYARKKSDKAAWCALLAVLNVLLALFFFLHGNQLTH